MADCGFHSPHFSEETAYLPPWLQPHQLPIVLTGVKDNSSTPMQPSQKIYYGDNICLEQNGQQCSSSEAGCNSCHLYLSGDTNSLHGSISLTGNAFHLSLHLSCTASQDENPPLSINNEISRTTRTKLDIKVKETHTDKTKDHIKTTKIDTLTLSQAGIEEVVELSVAASEAMVITEVVSLDSEASHFSVCNALQAALRVKDAREQLFSGGEDVSCASLEQQENDESGSLSDLDECAMAVAYADVGLSDKGAPDSNCHIHSLNSCYDSSLVPCSIKESTSAPHVFSFRNMNSKRVTAAAMETEKQGSDAFGGTERNLKEFEDNLAKDQEVAVRGNTCTRKIIKKLFVQESSFISESMDTSGIFPFVPVEEPQNEIVASSTPTNARNKCLNEGAFSSMDALCSVVPCSLSNPCMDQPSNEEKNLVDLQENLSSALDGAGVVTRTTRTLKEHSMVTRDVRFKKAPQTFDTKHLNNSDAMLNDVCEYINSIKCSGLQRREVAEAVGAKSKRVRFLEARCVDKEVKKSERLKHRKGHLASKSRRLNGAKYGLNCNSEIRRRKCSSFAGNSTEKKAMIFQGLDFLLTGLSSKKLRELQALIRQYGGSVLTKVPNCPSDLRAKLIEPTHWKPPVVICPKKLGTTKFLYGCAIDSWVLHDQWLIDSVQAGRLLPPSRYLIKQLRAFAQSYLGRDMFCFKCHTYIFDGTGFLLYGKVSFCSKFSNIIKHGGGQVFQSLQSLVHSLTSKNIKNGVILVENEASSSRHLKFCALEHNIQTLPVNWIIKTLHTGELAPLKKDRYPLFGKTEVPKSRAKDDAFDMSQEI